MQTSEEKKQELGSENIKSLLIKYSTPAIVAMLVNSLYNMVDTIFVGRGGGTMAIAGLAIAFPIQMLILAIAQTVGVGSASIISRSLGAGNQQRAEETAGNSFILVAVLSIFFSIIGLLYLDPILVLFGATETILPYASKYMTIIFIGNIFFSLAMSSNNIVRAQGFVKVAMKSMMIGAIGNIILDPIFIFAFDMGISGAALATVIAQTGSFIYIACFFMSKKSLLRIQRKHLAINWKIIPEIFAIGASSFARTVAGSLFAIVVNNSLGYYGAELHIAILGVAQRLLTFILMPMVGIVQGVQPILGYNYGARQIKRVKSSLKLAIIIATWIASFGFIIIMIFTKQIVSVFNNEPDLIQTSVPIIRIMIILIPLIGVQIVGASLFQAIGRAVPALLLSMSRQVLFLIPLVLILPLFFGLAGVFYAFPLADLLSAAVTVFWVKRETKIMTRRYLEPVPQQ